MVWALRVLLFVVTIVSSAISILLALVFMLTRLGEVYLPSELRPHIVTIFWTSCGVGAVGAVMHAWVTWRHAPRDV